MAISIKVNVTGGLRGMRPSELYAEPMRTFAVGLMSDGMAYLNANVPIDRGTLRNSLQPGVTETRIDGYPVAAIRWGTNLEYGRRLDRGEKGAAGQVEVAELERWVKRKKLATGKKARSLAYAIASVLRERGPKNPPHYVDGPHAGKQTKGWFAGLSEHVKGAAAGREARLVEDIGRRWVELKQRGG